MPAPKTRTIVLAMSPRLASLLEVTVDAALDRDGLSEQDVELLTSVSLELHGQLERKDPVIPAA